MKKVLASFPVLCGEQALRLLNYMLGDEPGKPTLPSKNHRSLPKIPAEPGSKPQIKPPESLPLKQEKPQLPKKGFSVSMEGREMLRSAPGKNVVLNKDDKF